MRAIGVAWSQDNNIGGEMSMITGRSIARRYYDMLACIPGMGDPVPSAELVFVEACCSRHLSAASAAANPAAINPRKAKPALCTLASAPV